MSQDATVTLMPQRGYTYNQMVNREASRNLIGQYSMKNKGKWNPADEFLTPKQKHETRKKRRAERKASAQIFFQAFFGVDKK